MAIKRILIFALLIISFNGYSQSLENLTVRNNLTVNGGFEYLDSSIAGMNSGFIPDTNKVISLINSNTPAAAGIENSIQVNIGGVLGYYPDLKFNGNTLELEADSGFNNIFIGIDAGNSITTGAGNTLTGYQSGYTLTSAQYNSAYGYKSLHLHLNGSRNSAFGYESLYKSTGSFNTGIGYLALHENTSGFYNVSIGSESGYSNILGSYNVFLGYKAGYNETGSNKLYIDVSDISTPLIYGEFDNDKLRFNADTSTFVGHVKVDSNIYVYGRSIIEKYEISAFIDPDSTITTSVNSTSWTFLGDGSNNKFTNLYVKGFSFDVDTIQFNQDINDLRDSIEFNFDAHANTSSTNVNKTILYTIQIKSIGESTYTKVRQITSGAQTETAGVYYPGPTCPVMPVFLKDGDKIQIVAKCGGASTSINTKYGKVYLKEQ